MDRLNRRLAIGSITGDATPGAKVTRGLKATRGAKDTPGARPYPGGELTARQMQRRRLLRSNGGFRTSSRTV